MGLIKDSSLVMAGVAVQRLLSIAMVPVKARLLGPKEYGIFFAAESACALLMTFASLSLEASVAVSRTKKQAAERTVGTIGIGLALGLFFGLFAMMGQPALEQYYSPDICSALLVMIPVMVPLGVANLSAQNYAAYLGKFDFFTIADVASSIAGIAAFFVAYFALWKDYRCLIASAMTILVVKVFIFLYCSKGTELFNKRILSTEIFESMWEARNFTKYNWPSNFLNSGTVQIPPILLSAFFSESIVGLFSMARTIIAIPMQLSAKALGQVFYPQAAREYRDRGRIDQITWAAYEYGCILTIFPAVLTVAAAGFILPLLLGPEWHGIAFFLLLLLPRNLFNAVQTQIGIGFIFSIMGEQFKILLGNVFLFVMSLLPIAICLLLDCSAITAILAFSVGSTISYAMLLAWVFKTTSISIAKASLAWLKYATAALICVVPVLTGNLLNANIFYLFICLLISIGVFLVVVWIVYLEAGQRASVKKSISEVFFKFKIFKNIAK